ncbi:MAG TPA: DUF748 domain-containing protein [Opitutaceae bacterium]|nr:DUF748 domain-containing protein [Opitutaceae bacterium]
MHLSAFVRRRRTLLLSLVGAFLLFTLAGFLLVPVIARRQILQHAATALHRPVAVEQVRFNPFTLMLTVRGFTVADHDRAELAGLDELTVNLAASSLLRRTWFFDSIRLVHPRARLVLGPDGQPNIADLFPAPETSVSESETPNLKPAVAAAAALPPVVVMQLLIERGDFHFVDRSRSEPFETHFSPFTLDLRHFTTRPDRTGNYSFEAATEAGERFAWRGNISVAPLASAGHFELRDLALAKYAPFTRGSVQLAPTAGKLALAADYEIRLGDQRVLRLANGSLALSGLQLAAPGAPAPAISAAEIRLENFAADAITRTASAAELSLRGGHLVAERRADGTIDLVALLAPPATATSAPSPAVPSSASSAPFSASLAKLAITDTALRLTDRAAPRPATLAVDQLALTLTNVGTALDRDVPLEASLRWNENGRITLRGTVRPQPLAASLEIDAADIALRPLDPYLAPFLDVLITGGTARAKGRLSVALPADVPIDLRWEGDLGLAGFASVDAEFSEPLCGFADLALTGVKLTTQPLALSLDELALREPFARVVVMPDRQINLMAALKPLRASEAENAKPETQNPEPETSPTPALSPPASRLSPQISLARVTIVGARLAATDRSIEPTFETELTDFGGTVTGLSSDPAARAAVALEGRLGPAPLRITGQLNLLAADAFSDVQVAFNGIELPPFTPYSGRYAGYVIDKGKLSLDLRYQLEKRELVAENKFTLDQFTFGQPVDSPDAVKLPLKLALAILRDRNGRIAENLPVRGNLDDPDFRYGSVVWHAVTNLIVKAATAPFSVLGGLFGGGRDLSTVEFAGGSAEFDPEAVARLDALVKALTERPGLSLEIASAPQPAADVAGLRANLLDTQLRARRVRELAATTSESIDPATVPLTPEDEQRLLAALLAERGAPAGATSPTPTATAPSPALANAKPETRNPKPNVVVRTFRRLFGRSSGPTGVTATPAEGPHGRPAAAPPDAAAAALPPVDDLRDQALATIVPADADFASLAARRASRIQEYLTGKGVEPGRVFLAPNAAPPAADPAARPRVVFNLR